MAFNRKNLLEDIVWVQDVYRTYSSIGLCNREILRRHINIPGRKAISERTFYLYLATPAARDLKAITEREKKQLSLFDFDGCSI